MLTPVKWQRKKTAKKKPTVKVGDDVSAISLPCDGSKRVRGKVLDVRYNLALLDLPHGAWVPLETVRKLRTDPERSLVGARAEDARGRARRR